MNYLQSGLMLVIIARFFSAASYADEVVSIDLAKVKPIYYSYDKHLEMLASESNDLIESEEAKEICKENGFSYAESFKTTITLGQWDSNRIAFTPTGYSYFRNFDRKHLKIATLCANNLVRGIMAVPVILGVAPGVSFECGEFHASLTIHGNAAIGGACVGALGACAIAGTYNVCKNYLVEASTHEFQELICTGPKSEIDPELLRVAQEQIRIGCTPIKVKEVSDDICGICREEFEVNNILIKPQCNHKFHYTCTTRWLNKYRTCPICRQEVVDSQKLNVISNDLDDAQIEK